MCRIAGIINPTSANLVHDIITMRDCMKHGGPDAEGVYIDDHFPLALGHRRLSFLDLSSAGNQPMADPTKQLQIVFNGEIYNFKDLKRELQGYGYLFTTASDTEVILKAYQQWGKDCFRRFNGMFALAIFDKDAGQLILARDHAGIKPLYYSKTASTFHFASEVRAFKALDPSWGENESWKIYFLTFGSLPEPFTTLDNVYSLPKGTLLVVDISTLATSAETFCSFTFSSSINSLAEAMATVKNNLQAAVSRHLISDAPIGLFLSGGLDSSLLTLLAHETLKDNLHTISIVFEDEKYSEARYQKLVIDKTGAKHSSCLVKEDEFFAALPDILKAMDQPSIDGINSYFISKYAHNNGLKAVLSGIGADELFGGYDSFHYSGRVKLLRKAPSFLFGLAGILPGPRKKKLSFLQQKDLLGEYLLHRGIFPAQQVASILNCSIQQVRNVLEEVKVPSANTIHNHFETVSWSEQNLYMQNQLLKDIDYMSMWFGLEVRVPFLDKELMEAAHSIAPNVKYDGRVKKHLLIKAFDDVLPKEISQRKKQGFIFPFKKWLTSVQTTNHRNPGYVKLFQQFQSGKIQWAHYWAYLLACQKNNIQYYNKAVKKILFLNLKTFSLTGGIEKFNRAFLKALSDLEKDGVVVADAISAYDNNVHEKYFTSQYYKGFNGQRLKFVYEAIKAAARYDTVILAHINLSLVGWLIKKLFPAKQIVLIAHGIEVWDKLGGVKNKLIQKADNILSVSKFTKLTIQKVHNLPPAKVVIFHNTIDPYFTAPPAFNKPAYLLERYGIQPHQPVIFTLTRLVHSEKYKGYDKVVEVMPYLKQQFPGIKYILSGKHDEQERTRLNDLKQKMFLDDDVILTGFVNEEEVVDHFLLADAFVMPSRKEGFGIVFIEAMACGLQVIAGNKDGSVDAVQNGELGVLIDPTNETEILDSIKTTLQKNNLITDAKKKKELQQKVYNAFGFETYKKNLEKILA